MTRRAYITITTEGRWALLRGGPSAPLAEAARVAGVELRWSKSDHAWLCPTSRLPDLLAAGELRRLLVVRSAA